MFHQSQGGINMQKILLLLLFLLSVIVLNAASDSWSRLYNLDTGFCQFKEEANFGLVFSGFALKHGITWQKDMEDRRFDLGYRIGLVYMESKDIGAFNLHFRPLDVFYGKKLDALRSELIVGPNLKADYNYQMYPDLQSLYDYWLTNYSLGIQSEAVIPIKEHELRIKLQLPLTGLVSRNEIYDDPYFAEGPPQILKHVHSNLKVKDFTKCGNITLQAFFLQIKRLRMSYLLEYDYYNPKPKLQILQHSLRFSLTGGSKK